jgi:basic amino acid/polyamine antiporter, APA family
VSLPFAEIQHAPQDRVGTAAMEVALGSGARYAMAAAILVSTFGCVNGLVLAGARVYYAMASDGLFFKSAGTTNSHHVPAVALAAQGIWAALLALPVTVTTDQATQALKYGNLYSDLLEYIIPVDVTFYTLMVGAVIALRIKAPFLNRPYRTVAHPLPALIYMTLAVLLVSDFIYLKPKTSGIGFLIVVAGIPVYLIWQRISDRKELARAPRIEPDVC